MEQSPGQGRTGGRVRRRYHFGTPELTYLFVTVLVALGAVNSQNNLLFWAFGFALSLLLVSGVLSGAMLMGIDVERVGMDQPRAGEACTITYRVRNRNRFVSAFALSIFEVDRVKRGRRGRAAQAARTVGGWRRRLAEPRGFVAHVGAGQTVMVRPRVMAVHRGSGRLTAVLVSSSFPFGIVRKSLLFEQVTEFVVHPTRETIDPSLVRETIRVGERGTTPTRRAGAGSEFFSLREYRGGDGLKAIAWRPSARRGELLVRQSAAPAPVRVIVALDLDPAADEAADERAISLAGSLIDVACEKRLEMGLSVPGAGVSIRPREGRLHQQRLLDELGRLGEAGRGEDQGEGGAMVGTGSRAAVVIIQSGAPGDWTHGVHGAVRVYAGDWSPGEEGGGGSRVNEGTAASAAIGAEGRA